MSAKLAHARVDRLDRVLWLQRISPEKERDTFWQTLSDREKWLQFYPGALGPAASVEQQARTARMDEMRLLQEVLALNPRNPEARRRLIDRQVEMVGWIAGKLDAEKHASFAGFQRYLSARGYREDDLATTWEGCVETMSVLVGNYWSTVINAGIPGYSRAEVEAEIASADQENVAKNQISLLAITRLCRNGLLLQEVRDLKPKELAQRMVLHTVARTPLDPAKASRVCQDIHETFAELTDLRELASGNGEEFEKFFGSDYYGAVDPERTWGEAIVDFFSPPMLLTVLGSRAIVRVEGNWAWFSTPSAAELATLEKAGKVQRGGDLFVTTLRLDKMGAWLSERRAVQALGREIVADQRVLSEMHWAERYLVRYPSRFAATLLVYGGAASLAEDSGVPGLKLMVDLIATLGLEGAAHNLLARAGVPAERMLMRVGQLESEMAVGRATFVEAKQTFKELEQFTEQLATSGKTLTGAERARVGTFVDKLAAARPPTVAPGFNPQDDVAGALAATGKALKKGDAAEASRALKSASETLEKMGKELDEWAQKVQQARTALQQLPQQARAEARRGFQSLKGAPNAHRFEPEGGYPKGSHGDWLNEGDNALRRGDFENAHNFYRLARNDAPRNIGDTTALHTFHDLVDYRLALADHARDLRQAFKKLRAAKRPLPVGVEIDTAAIQRQFQAGDLVVGKRLEGGNPVYLINDRNGKPQYVFKALTNVKEADLGSESFGSAVSIALKDELGINAAACQRMQTPSSLQNVLPRPLPDERYLAEGLLTRYIEGQPVWNLTEPVLVAIKDDYAKLRALRLWLGDTDGHLGNLRLGKDGRISPIDFGLSHLNSDIKHHRQITPEAALGREPTNQKDFLAACLKMPEYVRTQFGHDPTAPKYFWIERLDDMLSYDDMQGTVAAIKKLSSENDGQRLKDLLQKTLPAGEVDEAFQVLRERANVLDTVLKERFPQYKPPRSGAFLLDRWPHALAQLEKQTEPDIEYLAFAE